MRNFVICRLTKKLAGVLSLKCRGWMRKQSHVSNVKVYFSMCFEKFGALLMVVQPGSEARLLLMRAVPWAERAYGLLPGPHRSCPWSVLLWLHLWDPLKDELFLFYSSSLGHFLWTASVTASLQASLSAAETVAHREQWATVILLHTGSSPFHQWV